MKVLQICYSYPPNFAGYGRQLSTLNQKFGVYEDVNITLATCFYVPNDDSITVKVKSLLPFGRGKGIFDKYFFYLFCLALPFRFIIDFIKCDIVHVIKAGPEAMVATIFAKVLRKPIVIKVAQDEIDVPKTASVLKKLRIRVILKANALIAISGKIYNDLLSQGCQEVKVARIPNSVRSFPLSFKSDREVLELVFVGALCKRKGVDLLLEALKKESISKKINLTLVGPNYNDIGNFNFELGSFDISDKVTIEYVGEVSDASEYIAKSDALVLPSYSEGMPNVILEAFSSGVPVIASDIDVNIEIVKDFCGCLFSTGNAEDFANLLDRFDKSLYDSEEIQNYCKENFSVDAVANLHKELFSRILKNKKQN
ncbi:glycosyltransferase family 4 protein [Vibrio alginolyticus]|nr:glycosyltransferase family 4 protein [Vibrio alginolyticus]